MRRIGWLAHFTARRITALGITALGITAPWSAAPLGAQGDAPMDLQHPRTVASAFYAFRSYEPGRGGYVTLIANYYPLQSPGGGPHFYPLDPGARYDILVDNDGDGVEDISFSFRFSFQSSFLTLPVPPINPSDEVPLGLANVFPVGPGSPPGPPTRDRINWTRSYTVRVIHGPIDESGGDVVANGNTGRPFFFIPFDYIGGKSFPDYEAYSAQYVYPAQIPGCGDGRVFVGQRRESHAFNRGAYFDLVGIPNIVGPRDAFENPLGRFNVTSLALEVPIDCLTEGHGDTIGGWTTARKQKANVFLPDPTFEEPEDDRGKLVQVSRFGMPFLSSPQIGLPDANRFNTGHPKDDLEFERYFTHPSLPALLELLTQTSPVPIVAPTNIPRNDLVAFYLQGLPGLNQNGSTGNVLRLNVKEAVTPRAQQNSLGALAFDNAGFPNGRRPGDDVIDITTRVLEGWLCHIGFEYCDPGDAPAGLLPLTDQVLVEATDFQEAFPYLNTPLPGTTPACGN